MSLQDIYFRYEAFKLTYCHTTILLSLCINILLLLVFVFAHTAGVFKPELNTVIEISKVLCLAPLLQ